MPQGTIFKIAFIFCFSLLSLEAFAALKVKDEVLIYYNHPAIITKIVKVDSITVVYVKDKTDGVTSAWYPYQLKDKDRNIIANETSKDLRRFKVGDDVLDSLGRISKILKTNGRFADLTPLALPGGGQASQAADISGLRRVKDITDKSVKLTQPEAPKRKTYRKSRQDAGSEAEAETEAEDSSQDISSAKQTVTANASEKKIPKVMVKDQEGELVPAWDLIKGFSQDLIQKSIDKKFVYTQDPDLREIENQILRGLLKPEGGSVKLLAPAGVGKSVLIERLCARFANGDVPDALKNYHFMGFSAASLMAGGMYVGASESLVNAMIEQSKAMPILWIVDEAHALAGAGTHSESSSNIFQTLKPEMASGVIKMVGLSTPDEWAAAYDFDPALSRRFTRVDIPEPHGERLITILKSWLKKYQLPELSDGILSDVVRMSDEYGVDGAQPSRATALLAEIFSELRFNNASADTINGTLINLAVKRLYGVDPAELDPANRHVRYQKLQETLENLAGQDSAKKVLLEMTQQVLVGLQDRSKPRYRVIFGGPKGQGKTEMVKLFAKAMGLPEENRILMSAFTTEGDVDAMKNQIATYVLRNSFTVLFFDEIEKAHPVVQRALLGILDAGMMTYQATQGSKSAQRTLRLKNTSVFMATNAGQSYIASLDSKDDFDREKFRVAMETDGLDEYMLDRMDAAVPFFFLDKNEFRDVLKIHIAKTVREIRENKGVQIELKNNEAMINGLTELYFKPRMSNRDVARIVNEHLRSAVTAALFHQAPGQEARVLSFGWSGRQLTPVKVQRSVEPAQTGTKNRCPDLLSEISRRKS